MLHVDKAHQPGQQYPGIVVPESSNVPSDKHFADLATPGSIVIMQQPSHHTAALCGDILATRYKLRGILGVLTDGRLRDVVRLEELCKEGGFTAWAKSLSCGNSKQGMSMPLDGCGSDDADEDDLIAKPWAVDIPLQIGELQVKPGDILVADEGEMACCVIPRDKLDAVMELLPIQKEADDGFYNDVKSGMDIKSSLKRWPKHYSISDPVPR